MHVLLLCASSVGFAPPLHALAPRSIVHEPHDVVMSGALGRRAAFIGALTVLPTLRANADSIEEIAKRNAEAAAAAKSPEALAAKEADEKGQENSQVLASTAITLLLVGSTVISFPASGTTENVKRLGDKVKTGKGRSRY